MGNQFTAYQNEREAHVKVHNKWYKLPTNNDYRCYVLVHVHVDWHSTGIRSIYDNQKTKCTVTQANTQTWWQKKA